MKHFLVFMLFLFSSQHCSCQFGIKAGTNYSFHKIFNGHRFNNPKPRGYIGLQYQVNIATNSSIELGLQFSLQKDDMGSSLFRDKFIQEVTVEFDGETFQEGIDYVLDENTCIASPTAGGNFPPGTFISYYFGPWTSDVTHYNLILPFLFKYEIPFKKNKNTKKRKQSKHSKAFIKAGPSFNIGLIGNMENEHLKRPLYNYDDPSAYNLKRLNIVASIGIGFEFKKGIFFELVYNNGMNNLLDKKPESVLHIDHCQLGVGYQF